MSINRVSAVAGHRTVIVDGVDPLSKESVAHAMRRCGPIAKWWSEASASNKNSLRLFVEFAHIDDLGAVALLNGMRFGEQDISCRIADSSAHTNINFTSVLSITAGPSSSSASAANNTNNTGDNSSSADDNAPAHIRAMRAMLRGLAADSSVQRSISAPGDEVTEALVSDPAKLNAFLDDQGVRQVKALLVLSKAYIQSQKAELRRLIGGPLPEDPPAPPPRSAPVDLSSSSTSSSSSCSSSIGTSSSSSETKKSSKKSKSDKKKKKKDKRKKKDKKKSKRAKKEDKKDKSSKRLKK